MFTPGKLMGDYDNGDSIRSATVWSFDPANDLLATVTHNSDEGGVSSTHVTELFYDSYGRADRSDITIDGVQYTERTTYDQYGRVYQQFDASGNNRGTQYSYNSYGYLQTQSEALIVNGSQQLYVEYREMDARGNVTQEYLGNGLTTNRFYNAETGRLETILTAVSGMPAVQDLQMQYDTLGNLLEKSNFRQGLIESYCYDDLNRLTGTAVQNSCNTDEFVYDSLGNITQKGTVNDYVYGNGNATGVANDAGPHAVTNAGGINYYYDDNGNMTHDDSGRVLSYTVFDKPFEIAKGADINIAFRYGPDRARYRRIDTNAGVATTTHYVGSVEFIDRDGVDEIKRYIGGRLVITGTENTVNSALQDWAEQYLLKDHIGSVDVIVGASGGQSGSDQLVSFDAWGQRRDGEDLQTLLNQTGWEPINLLTTRGFTGHEMLDAVGLIHMNGRIYDPKLGRFLQADPFVDGVTDTQGYNRYSYVHNNPLSYTDPSGYGASGGVWTAVKIVIAVILTFACEGGCAPQAWAWALGSASAHQAANQGGNVGQIAVAAFSGAVMGYLGGAYGADTLGLTKFVGWSALAGGITAELQGGKFGHGFISAGVGAAAGSIGLGNTPGPLAVMGRTLIRSVIGGTISKATGGKFANGAAYAAFASILGEAARAPRKLPVAKPNDDGVYEVSADMVTPNDAPDGYDSHGEAAEAAAIEYEREYLALSADQELRGMIVEADGRHYYTEAAITPAEATTIRFNVPNAPNNASFSASYHTHPVGGGYNFSRPDHRSVNKWRLPGYLRNSRGDFKVLTPGSFNRQGINACSSGVNPCFSAHPDDRGSSF